MSEFHSILATLVGFDTTSDQSNLTLIEWVESYLDTLNITHERIADPQEAKASLLARIGPQAPGGLIFSGHTDVVPVTDQPWQADPFVLRETNDSYIARGACDMKGFIACVLANAPQWAKLPLTQPIYFAFSYDEETGCDKAPPIAERLQALGAQNAWAIIGEPTLLKPVIGQKGIVNLRTTVTGKAAHSSQILHQGLSAVHEAAKLTTYIEQVMYDLIADGEVDPAFNVPHSSLHVGIIAGGTAHNILARKCTFDWEIRNLPSQTVESILARVDRYASVLIEKNADLNIHTEFTSPIVPGLQDHNNADILALIRASLPEKSAGECVAYATEAGHFQQAGFQAVIFGPGSIAQAHQPEEWIAKSQLRECIDILDTLVHKRCLTPFS